MQRAQHAFLSLSILAVNLNDDLDYYQRLPVLSSFNDIDKLDAFFPAPDSWWVVIADVKNSTQAVSRGEYKEVNMIGASCITAVLNQLKPIEIPYVFGGDGATLLIPDCEKKNVEVALISIRALSMEEFELDLRIGFVSVAQIRNNNRDVLIAKYQISKGNDLAMFAGGGAELADRLIKDDEACEKYALAPSSSTQLADLSGLSCRWQPLKSTNGQMICLLIQALDRDLEGRHQILSHVLAKITGVLGKEMSQSNPVTGRSLKFKWPPPGLKMEARLTKGSQSFLRRYLFVIYQSFVQAVLERFDLSAGSYDAPVYRREIQSNADYRRFDDALRLVLDLSYSQIDAITEMLNELHQNGKVAYGMHQTDQAQMTCLVFSFEQSEHIHFVDGADGGFWAAAVQYKKQLASKGIKSLP